MLRGLWVIGSEVAIMSVVLWFFWPILLQLSVAVGITTMINGYLWVFHRERFECWRPYWRKEYL